MIDYECCFHRKQGKSATLRTVLASSAPNDPRGKQRIEVTGWPGIIYRGCLASDSL
jgi:hypothetical protein